MSAILLSVLALLHGKRRITINPNSFSKQDHQKLFAAESIGECFRGMTKKGGEFGKQITMYTGGREAGLLIVKNSAAALDRGRDIESADDSNWWTSLSNDIKGP